MISRISSPMDREGIASSRVFKRVNGASKTMAVILPTSAATEYL